MPWRPSNAPQRHATPRHPSLLLLTCCCHALCLSLTSPLAPLCISPSAPASLNSCPTAERRGPSPSCAWSQKAASSRSSSISANVDVDVNSSVLIAGTLECVDVDVNVNVSSSGSSSGSSNDKQLRCRSLFVELVGPKCFSFFKYPVKQLGSDWARNTRLEGVSVYIDIWYIYGRSTNTTILLWIKTILS